ncbi:hypothetical protein [Streptomyces mirabilis]|uniref:hypothetical protein n=1 Tax=Streptomyces mirabilis TaxID=68239 RepID=UPI0022514859|nr:hypothetical protein [Streptomyces mirabilis]MCX4420351.1 hypothetical protein [Streptomyces mirabilis]
MPVPAGPCADWPRTRTTSLVIGARARARRAAVRRQVSAHARCPVLTVPAPAFARRERRALRRATARDFADFAAG